MFNEMFASKPIPVTSWHPIQRTASHDRWELPHPRSSMEDNSNTEIRTAPSWGSMQGNSETRSQPIRTSPSWGSTQGSSDTQSQASQTSFNGAMKKRRALDDATNTAPVLRVRRSQFQ